MLITKRLRQLIIINAVLVTGLILSLTLQSKKTITFNDQLFNIGDSGQIDVLKIQDHRIVKTSPNNWYINKNHYRASNAAIATLMLILKRLKIKRPISKSLKDSILNNNIEKKILISSYSKNKLINNFSLFEHQGQFIAAKDKQVYNVYIPGYNFDIYDYLNFTAESIRDKQVFKTSWKTLNKLKITYPNQFESLDIGFKNSFYEIKGISQLDTLKLYNYINEIEHLETELFIENKNLLNKLNQTNFIAKLFVEDINYPIATEVTIYESNDSIYGVSNTIEGIMTFKNQIINTILVDKEYFEKHILK